jgi:hypothetical protein
MPTKTASKSTTMAILANLETSTDPKIRAEAKRLRSEFEADAELDRRMGIAKSGTPHRSAGGRNVICPVMTQSDALKFLAQKKKQLGYTG